MASPIDQFLTTGIACLGCGAISTTSSLSSAAGFCQATTGNSFFQPDYRILECAACGLLFRCPTLSDEQLSAYYSSLEPIHWEYPSLNPPEKFISRKIAALPAGARILDFGCSSGRLLAPWVSLHQCLGFEINAEAAGKAAGRGLTMLTERQLWSGESGQFNMVVLVDVFEHLRHPTELLTRLWALIAPGGCLVVSTGNGDHWACRLDPAQFWYFRNLEHLCMITARYSEYLNVVLGGVREDWTLVSHYEIPWHARMRLHAAHSAYWICQYAPKLIREIMSVLPGFRKVVRWKNSPYYACCNDHVVFSLSKT